MRAPTNKAVRGTVAIKGVFDCDLLRLLQGSFGPFGPKVQKKSENGFPGPLGPGVEKVEKESKKSRKRVQKAQKIVNFGLFFDSFSTPGAESPPRRAQMTPVAGEEDRKFSTIKRALGSCDGGSPFPLQGCRFPLSLRCFPNGVFQTVFFRFLTSAFHSMAASSDPCH